MQNWTAFTRVLLGVFSLSWNQEILESRLKKARKNHEFPTILIIKFRGYKLSRMADFEIFRDTNFRDFGAKSRKSRKFLPAKVNTFKVPDLLILINLFWANLPNNIETSTLIF